MSQKVPYLRFFRRMTAALLLVLLVVGSLFIPTTVSAATEEESLASRLINVVYDDSNSMIMDGNTAWSEAKYSMEILSAMMQEEDMMNIYYMSEYTTSGDKISEIKNLSGKSGNKQSNINKIHNAISNTSGTYFDAIKAAYNDLKEFGSSYDERHLVVLTDGNSFSNGESKKDLDNLFANAAKDNIKVVYLAIADPRGAQTIKPTESPSVFVADATPNSQNYDESILGKVAEICERIFQRPKHSKDNPSIELKVPVSEIVVFAQGKDVSIGDIKGTKKHTNDASLTMADVDKATRHPDNGTIGGIENIVVAEGLGGMVATFTPSSGDYIPEGKYNIKVNAASYTVYYKPCLDVKLDLKDASGNQVNNDDTVNIGSYTAEYFLTYPKGHDKHGEKIALAGLGIDPAYIVTVTTDGTPTEYSGDSPKTVELKAGITEVKVTAKYLTYISTDQSVNLVVEDMQVYDLDVTIDPEKKDYLASELASETEGYKVKVAIPDGTAITPEQWAACEIKLNSDGIEFYEAVKNSDFSFTVRPKLLNGSYKDTKTGEIPFKATVSIRDEKQRRLYKGNDDGIVNLYNDVVPNRNGFKVEITEIGPTKIKSTEFNNDPPFAKVTITWNGNPLTRAQYDALQLKAVMRKDYKVKDDAGKEVSLLDVTSVKLDPFEEGKPTTATLSFKANGTAEAQRTKLHKYDDFKVTATIDREGVKNEASDTDNLGVKRVYTPLEIIGLILLALLIIFLLLAYVICKKWLPFKIFYQARTGSPKPVYLYANAMAWLTALVPFMGVVSTVPIRSTNPDGTSCSPKLKIQAAKGKKKATLLNAMELYQSKIYADASNVKIDAYKKTMSNKSSTGKKKKLKPITFNLKGGRINKNGTIVATFCGTKIRRRR